MLRVAICDDDAKHLDNILQYSKDYFASRNESASFQTFSTPSDFIDALDKNMLCDIALLDIYMPGLLGTELAKEIKSKSPGTEIIFLTTSDEFALEAFSVQAVDYLLKPFTRESFNRSLDLVMKHLGQRHIAKIAFRPYGGGVQIEEASNIAYAESYGHSLSVHLTSGSKIEVRQTLQALLDELEKLAPGQFVSPYRGLLVNLAEVQNIDPEFIMISNTRLPLGQRRYRDFQKIYFDFMFAAAHRNTDANKH